ncbi:DUF1878 family protein [Oceanobacillus profundus]|uniref:DUF1878 family protein n=2 Tax=Bacillaceae TaxID=186817 RepID=A0A417YMV0_9BACI|nr:DUF1878 family protein [Oceanobacillus sp.]PAE29497.1 hypothetical protein CHI07_08865 [Paenibacillus sp. 7884-2]RHW34633.1 DUF1878 family protein [Oceanobacillus profundus]
MNQYPVIKMIIEHNLTRKEYNEMMEMIQSLNDAYELQKEEGLLDFTSLLIQFAGMLNEKLDPNKTIEALKLDGCYPMLMSEFSKILEEYDRQHRRR